MKIVIDTDAATINVLQPGTPSVVVPAANSTTYAGFVAEATALGVPTAAQLTTQQTQIQKQIDAANGLINTLTPTLTTITTQLNTIQNKGIQTQGAQLPA